MIVERDDVEYFVREKNDVSRLGYVSGPGFTVLKSSRGRKRDRERNVEKKRKKEGKEGRGREVSRQDGRKFDIYERGRREGEF